LISILAVPLIRIVDSLDNKTTKSVVLHLSEVKKRGDKVYRILIISNVKQEFRYDYEAALKCAMELCAKGKTWNQNPISRTESETRDWSFEKLALFGAYVSEKQKTQIVEQLKNEDNLVSN